MMLKAEKVAQSDINIAQILIKNDTVKKILNAYDTVKMLTYKCEIQVISRLWNHVTLIGARCDSLLTSGVRYGSTVIVFLGVWRSLRDYSFSD